MKRAFRRLAYAIGALALLWVAVTASAVLALRWIDPPASALMWQAGRALPGEGSPLDRVRYRWVGYDAIHPGVALAVIAAEDQRFPLHHGFDWSAIWNALRHNLQGGRLLGASSISQQVAKNLFLWRDRTLARKALEAYFTSLIELSWPKRRILEVYLNVAQFGPRTFGIGAAAEHFFGKTPATLTDAESALLAAVLPGPSIYRAHAPSRYVQKRQQWILRQMHFLGTGYLERVERPDVTAPLPWEMRAYPDD